MRSNPLSEAVYTAVAWTPILAFVTAVVLVLSAGVMQLEARTNGTSFFISNTGEAHPSIGQHLANGDEVILPVAP